MVLHPYGDRTQRDNACFDIYIQCECYACAVRLFAKRALFKYTTVRNCRQKLLSSLQQMLIIFTGKASINWCKDLIQVFAYMRCKHCLASSTCAGEKRWTTSSQIGFQDKRIALCIGSWYHDLVHGYVEDVPGDNEDAFWGTSQRPDESDASTN